MQPAPQGFQVSSAGARATMLSRQLGQQVVQTQSGVQSFVTRGGTFGGPNLLAGLIVAAAILAYHFKRLL